MEYLKKNKPLVRPLSLAAGIIGIIQSACWLIFNILALFYYFEVISLPEELAALPKNIYYLYLDENQVVTTESKIKVTAEDFMAFMFTYLILNVFWLVVSSFLVYFMIRDKWSQAYKYIIGWSAVVNALLIVDLVLGILLAHDLDYYNNLPKVDIEVINATAVVMSLAFRGYVLWVVDLIFFCILVKFAGNLYLEKKHNKSHQSAPKFETNVDGSYGAENDFSGFDNTVANNIDIEVQNEGIYHEVEDKLDIEADNEVKNIMNVDNNFKNIDNEVENILDVEENIEAKIEVENEAKTEAKIEVEYKIEADPNVRQTFNSIDENFFNHNDEDITQDTIGSLEDSSKSLPDYSPADSPVLPSLRTSSEFRPESLLY